MSDEFALNLTGSDMEGVQASDGSGFKRIPLGDYNWKITDVEQKAKEGEKPHVMLVVTRVITDAADDANKHAIGMTDTSYFAGSKESPKFMQQRLKCLMEACQIKLTPGQSLSRSHFIGRTHAATVVWELSQAKMDQNTGEMKQYVNARVLGERPIGAPRPVGINPSIDSREAIKYLEERYGDAGTGTTPPAADAAPWGGEAPAAQASAQATAPASSFRPESEADGVVHTYRAYIKLDSEYKDQARTQLTQVGFDPDGPVDPNKLTDPGVKAQYLAKFPQAPAGGLPGLPGLPPPGGNAAGNKPKTGTRSARQ